MSKTRRRRTAHVYLRRNLLGTIVVAWLLAAAVKTAAHVLENPVAWVLAQLINWLGERGLRSAFTPLNAHEFALPPQVMLFGAMRSAVLLVAALLLTTWLYPAVWRRTARTSGT